MMIDFQLLFNALLLSTIASSILLFYIKDFKRMAGNRPRYSMYLFIAIFIVIYVLLDLMINQ